MHREGSAGGGPPGLEISISLSISPHPPFFFFPFDSGPIRISASSSDELRGGFSKQLDPNCAYRRENSKTSKPTNEKKKKKTPNQKIRPPQASQAPRCRPAARTAGANSTALPAAGGAHAEPCGAEGAASLPPGAGCEAPRVALRCSPCSPRPQPAGLSPVRLSVGVALFPWIVVLFSRSPSRLSPSLGTFRALLSRPSHLFGLCSFGEKTNARQNGCERSLTPLFCFMQALLYKSRNPCCSYH